MWKTRKESSDCCAGRLPHARTITSLNTADSGPMMGAGSSSVMASMLETVRSLQPPSVRQPTHADGHALAPHPSIHACRPPPHTSTTATIEHTPPPCSPPPILLLFTRDGTYRDRPALCRAAPCTAPSTTRGRCRTARGWCRATRGRPPPCCHAERDAVSAHAAHVVHLMGGGREG